MGVFLKIGLALGALLLTHCQVSVESRPSSEMEDIQNFTQKVGIQAIGPFTYLLTGADPDGDFGSGTVTIYEGDPSDIQFNSGFPDYGSVNDPPLIQINAVRGNFSAEITVAPTTDGILIGLPVSNSFLNNLLFVPVKGSGPARTFHIDLSATEYRARKIFR